MLSVEEQTYRPFMYKKRVYQRIESTTFAVSSDTIMYMLMQARIIYWEALPNPSLQIDDLDREVILGAVRASIACGRMVNSAMRDELPVILEKLNLLNDGKLKNAAAVLFGRKLHDYPQCLLRLARFKGTNTAEFLDNQRVQGNIFALLDAVMAFFFKHLSLSGKIEGLYRQEELSIPYKALRECCINAFCHRDYSYLSGSVGVAIYDNRVEIESVGSLPRGMTREKLFQRTSRPANPCIANVLYKCELLESWGRGIELMVDECRRVGIPDPEISTDESTFKVVFHYESVKAGPTATLSASTGPTVIDYPVCVQQLVSVLGGQTYSLQEMMGLMGLKDRNNFVHNYLTPSQESGLVEPLYPDQPRHPKQKYRLTESGKLFWQEQKEVER